MKKPSEQENNWQEKHDQIIGLGEQSMRKSYFPQLRERLGELERYRLLLDQTSEIILIVEIPSGRLVDGNRTALELLETPSDKISTLFITEYFDREDLADPWQEICESTPGTERRTVRLETVFCREGKYSLPVELTLRRASIENKWYAVIMARDIGERLASDASRLRLEEKIHRIQRLESLGTLAGGIAHDFNNLLMSILGNVSLMEMDLPDDNIFAEYLDPIKHATTSATELTKQLLGLARGGRYQVVPTDLNVLLQEVCKLFGRTHKGTTIDLDLDNKLVTTCVDRGQIEQVLLNLLVNAEHAMLGHGRIEVQTRNIFISDIDEENFRLNEGWCAELKIIDSGSGMDKKTQKQIFDPFFSTKKEGRGTGLGLASAFGIISNHGGIISVYSELGVGSAFRLLLPQGEGQHQEIAAPAGDLVTGQGTVLIVDDEEIIREVSKKLLTKLGFEVLVACSGEEAAQLYSTSGAGVSLAILDMIMPGSDGEATFIALREIDPELKIIIASGHSADNTTRELLSKGNAWFLQKPFSLIGLSMALKKAL